LGFPVEAVQVTLSGPSGATVFVLAVIVYTAGATGAGVLGAGLTGVGVGADGELPPQPRVIPRNAARIPCASIDRTILFVISDTRVSLLL
jgi:hypothetical protein